MSDNASPNPPTASSEYWHRRTTIIARPRSFRAAARPKVVNAGVAHGPMRQTAGRVVQGRFPPQREGKVVGVATAIGGTSGSIMIIFFSATRRARTYVKRGKWGLGKINPQCLSRYNATIPKEGGSCPAGRDIRLRSSNDYLNS